MMKTFSNILIRCVSLNDFFHIKHHWTKFNMTVPEADIAAQNAGQKISITARCSVFAKSEMTHFANQGKPAGDLFKGIQENPHVPRGDRSPSLA